MREPAECASPPYSASVQSVLERGGSGAAGLLVPPQAWGLALPATPQPHCECHNHPGLPSWTQLTAQGPSLPPGRDGLAHGGLGTHGHPPGARHTVGSSDWCWEMTQPPEGHTRPRPMDQLDDVRTKRSERLARAGPSPALLPSLEPHRKGTLPKRQGQRPHTSITPLPLGQRWSSGPTVWAKPRGLMPRPTPDTSPPNRSSNLSHGEEGVRHPIWASF